MKKNLTLAIEVDLLDQVRVFAAKHRTSVTELVRRHLRSLVEDDAAYRKAAQRIERRARERPLAVGGARWRREDLHDR